MRNVDDLFEVEKIKQLKARYFRFLDTKDWDGFETLFTEDAVLDSSMAFYAPHPVTGEPLTHGRPELVAGIQTGDMVMIGGKTMADKGRQLFPGVITMHHGHMPEIEILSDDQATGVWPLEDRLLFPEGAPIREVHGFGHYFETYRKVDGHWKIACSKLTRLRVNVE
jgi:hypothetical protein